MKNLIKRKKLAYEPASCTYASPVHLTLEPNNLSVELTNKKHIWKSRIIQQEIPTLDIDEKIQG